MQIDSHPRGAGVHAYSRQLSVTLQGLFEKSAASDYSEMPVDVAQAKDADDGDYGMLLTREARRYAVTAPFATPVSTRLVKPPGHVWLAVTALTFAASPSRRSHSSLHALYCHALSRSDDQPLVVQYEVRLQEGLTCGGAYIKLYQSTPDFTAATVTPNTPYVIMFGPDKCGSTDKVHFIIRWRNPVSGEYEEKHLVSPPKTKTADKNVHLYTLVIRPDDTYAIKIDDEVEKEGKLAEDFSPSILPPAEIDDSSDRKPADWVDTAEIADPAASKPEGWDENAPMSIPDDDAVKPEGWLDDEPEFVPDPTAVKPEGWDEEEDGEWVAPTIANPKCEADGPGCGVWTRPTKRNPAYKGKWKAPMIPNPAYIGEWKPRKIQNPSFFTDDALHRLGGQAIGGVGVEVWTMNGGMLFDNFLVARNEDSASSFAQGTWRPKFDAQVAAAAKADDEEARARRETAAAEGGVLEKIAYYSAEAVDMARENPTAAIATLVVTIVSLSFMCFSMCASGVDEFEPETAPSARPAARKAEVVNAAGAVESDDEDESDGNASAQLGEGAPAAPAAAVEAPAAAETSGSEAETTGPRRRSTRRKE